MQDNATFWVSRLLSMALFSYPSRKRAGNLDQLYTMVYPYLIWQQHNILKAVDAHFISRQTDDITIFPSLVKFKKKYY